MNHLAPYASLRAVNAGGTQEVLRLASEGRVKSVHLISSTSAVHHLARESGAIAEEFAPGDGPPAAEAGYSRSKWAAERLVQLAAGRGIRGLVHRPSAVVGSARDGVCNPGDFVFRRLRACVQLGAAPGAAPGGDATGVGEADGDLELNLVPVDFVAEAVATAVLAPDAAPPVMHLASPEPQRLGAVLDLLEPVAGRVDRLPYAAW